MSELWQALGINWKLLLAQGVNFFVLLTVLTALIYRPLLKILEDRRKKIELGVKGGEEVQKRLEEADRLKAEKIRSGEKEALAIIASSEKSARERAGDIIAETKLKAGYILQEAEVVAAHKRLEEIDRLQKEASNLIRTAIAKAVELEPEKIDEHLVTRATGFLKDRAV